MLLVCASENEFESLGKQIHHFQFLEHSPFPPQKQSVFLFWELHSGIPFAEWFGKAFSFVLGGASSRFGVAGGNGRPGIVGLECRCTCIC